MRRDILLCLPCCILKCTILLSVLLTKNEKQKVTKAIEVATALNIAVLRRFCCGSEVN